ncbi:hypothetical protein F2Q68_00004121 [Brassica cretica]|uniref:Uncharacterized protein n=1 Tax=Brassica cretica TaxID=69181 RepID=A0A8S9JEL3_BRACR|nr:hypothetical protein F2Q68_00004121 [Brassica cretica]
MSWASVTVAGRCNGEVQSAHGSSEVAHQVSLSWVSWRSAQLSLTECSGLGPVGQVWAVTGPVGWPRMAMSRWALGIEPGAWVIREGFSVTFLGVDKQAQDVWRTVPWLFRNARDSFYTLKHKEKQRKDRELVGFNIQPQEWALEHMQIVREEEEWLDSTSYGQDSLKGRGAWEDSFMGVENDPVMKLVSWESHGWRVWCDPWMGSLVRPMNGSYQYWRYVIRPDQDVCKRSRNAHGCTGGNSKTDRVQWDMVPWPVRYGGTEPWPWPVQEVIVLGHWPD